jgi:hypothetical protein
MTPRLNWFDKIILWLFGKRASFRSITIKGPDPYGGHNLEITLNSWLTITIGDVVSWTGHVGKAFFNEDDKWIMPLAKRIFYAFEQREIVNDYNSPDEYGGARGIE